MDGRRIITPVRLRRAVASGALGLAIAGCSSSQPGASRPAATTANPPVTTAPIPDSAAGAAYLADVGPADAALSAFAAKAGTWTASTSTAEAASDAAPAVAALQMFDAALRSQPWPSGALAHVQGLIADDAAVLRDLQGIAQMHQLNASTWFEKFKRDLAVDSSAAALLRRDLGLPGASPIG
jgi:hypothetical protein